MNGSPEHLDAPTASSTPSAPSSAVPATPSPAAAAAPSPAVPAAPSPAAPAAAAAAPGPAAPVSAAPPLPAAGAAVPPSPQGAMPRFHRKSPFLAGLLSLMPGIGQIYVGYYALGFIHIAVFATTIALLASAPPLSGLSPALGVFLGFFVIYNIVDACRRATLYNLAVDGVQGIELPDMNAPLPKLQGSVTGGVALIAFGVLLLSNTLFGLSLDWLESWWPMGLVGLGAYLVAKARQERSVTDPPAGGGES